LLVLCFVSSAGVYVFLAVSMSVLWPLPIAVLVSVMAGGCVFTARRER